MLRPVLDAIQMLLNEARYHTTVLGYALITNGDDNIAFAFTVGATCRWIHVASEDGIHLYLENVNNHPSVNQGIKLLHLDRGPRDQ
jgi:hypothetical protein